MRRCHHAIGMRWNEIKHVMKQSEHTMSRKHLQLYELLTQTFVTPFKRPQRHNKSICTSTAFQELLQTDDDVIHYRLRNQLSITSPLTSGQCTVVLNTRTCWKRCHLDIRRTATVADHRTDLHKHPSPVQHGGNAHEAGESTIPGRRGGNRHDSRRSRFARFRHFARPRSGVYIRERAVDKDNKATARLRDARASCTQSERLNGPEEHCRS